MQRSERRKVFRAAEIAFKLKEANPELTLDELLFGEDPYKDVAEALYGEILPDLKEMRAVAASAILAKQYDWDRKQAAQVDAEVRMKTASGFEANLAGGMKVTSVDLRHTEGEAPTLDVKLEGRPMKGPRPYSKAAVPLNEETVTVRGQPRNVREFDAPSDDFGWTSPRAG